MFVRLAETGVIGSTVSARTALRQQFDRARDDAGIDRGIDPHRQMWPMLFHRANGKHCDGSFAIEPREIDGRQIPPPTRDHV